MFISDRDTPNPVTSPYYGANDLTRNDADSILVATAIPALAIWTSHEIFVSGPKGDHGWIRRLTFDYQAGTGWAGRVPIWSPNGRYIRFDQWRTHGATALGQRERLLIWDCGAVAGAGAGCVRAARRVGGRRLGAARLGRGRVKQRRVLGGRLRGRRGGMDRWCVEGGGALRIGYPTGRLSRSHSGRGLVRRARKKALIVLTTNGGASIRGLTRGSTVRALRRAVRGERRYRIGRNVWFVAPGKRSQLVFKTRRGRVLELGIADRRLTRSRPEVRSLLHAWHL